MNTCISTPSSFENAIIGMPLPQEDNTDCMSPDAHRDALFTQALTIAHNTPDIREDKIAAIRAQLQNGTYEIDFKKLAESLIRENPGLFEE